MTNATRKCPVCGAANPARARFCGDCGTAFQATPAGSAPARGAGSPIMPWFLAGVAVLAIQTTVLVLALKRPQPAGAGDMTNAGAPALQGGAPATRAPDISNMTPREAADRLYDRIARASEAGDSGQVSFFGPMALQAYGRVTPLDADARLHLGLIQLALGDAAAAAAQADTITRESGAHLFGPLLAARAADARGNRNAARQAYRRFAASYDAERARNLPEYEQHNTVLLEARAEAARAGR